MEENAVWLVSGIDMVVRVAHGRQGEEVKEFGPRKYHGLILELTGSVKYVVDNQRVFVNQPGNLLYLKQGVPYRIYGYGNTSCICVNFYMKNEPENSAFQLLPENGQYWQDMFQSMLSEWESLHPGHYERTMSTLYRIIAAVKEEGRKSVLASSHLHDVQVVSAYLEEHISDASLSVEAAMRTVSLSRTHLRNQFEQAYGMTPRDYLTSLRINRAQMLLTTTAKTISQIAAECGYDSLYNFSRAFSRETGRSPSQYRKEY